MSCVKYSSGSSPRTWGTPSGRGSTRHTGPVHPHARGERQRTACGPAVKAGSSPRTWGTPALQGRARQRVRFIPTHVGNAALPISAPTPISVHPHARGERKHVMASAVREAGSSPRTWGTPIWLHASRRHRRFIPTHVGNAFVRLDNDESHTVHPHARGERLRGAGAARRHHRFIPTHVGNAYGCLPLIETKPVHPHARGERVAANELPSGRYRFIPTHVGNARTGAEAPMQVTVHPHARGERSGQPRTGSMKTGSSPRTWGTHEGPDMRFVIGRFIPTHVGNAMAASLDCSLAIGSSPRTWGTLFGSLRLVGVSRFIPTHVGNAPCRGAGRPVAPVHPHARGERDEIDTDDVETIGSSPRTWGTPRPQSSGRMRPPVHPHARGERTDAWKREVAYGGSSPRTWGTLGQSAGALRMTRFIPTHVGNASPSRTS